MAKVVIVGGMCGIITSWNSFLIGGSRAMYSMAESYMIPKTFAKLHPKHKTPINALILIGVLTMLAPFAGRQLLVWISDAGNFACCLAYCMVAVSFMILRKKEPDMPRQYKAVSYTHLDVYKRQVWLLILENTSPEYRGALLHTVKKQDSLSLHYRGKSIS